MTTHTCDICPATATAHRSVRGVKFHACAEHEKYLAGWVRDYVHEQACDAIAERRYEDAAYGDD